ncbi:MAG: TRAP transporter small permease [Burkholderiaceae bacterium]|nr:TRAP transporter small permease [Burkholderiaceae bacterium]
MWKFLDQHFEELLGAILLAVMACIACINVFVRYCTNFSFSASEELTVNLFVWIVLLGTARAFRENSNFCMSLLYNAMPKSIRFGLYIFILLCSVAFFACLCWLGTIEVMDEFELNVSSESLAIPVWIYTMATPLFSALIVFRILQKAIEDIKNRTY